MVNSELEASIVDPSREEEVVDVNAMKEEISSSEPLFQTQENHYYPPEPTFKPPEPCSYAPRIDFSAEEEKPPKNLEQEEMIRKVKSLEQSFRNMQGLGGQMSVAYKDLCLFPDVQLPARFKLPKFDLYDGHGDLVARLRGFCKKCWHLKTAIQELIDTRRIEVQALETPNITQNPLPAHHETHMIEHVQKGEYKKPSQTIMMIRASENISDEKPTSGRAVTKVEKTVSKPVVVIKKEPLRGVAAKVVVLGVAVKPIVTVKGARTEPVIIKPVTQLPVINEKAVPWNYGRLRKAKTTKDNPVPVKRAVTEEEAEEFLKKMKAQDYSIIEQLRKTPTQISLLSLLIHSDEHRQALMKILSEAHVPEKISVNHLEKIANNIFEVNRVTFSDDDANICPLSTLEKLKVESERIHKNSICVRGFDGGGKDTVGDIVLELTIGPVEFTMEFQ
ncbi:PREDICTED: uncharacterized protein LOC109222662, partial [Nicotiana attenuata]|uniref:uncharacterized protein LOC109222662 n=1 Tax=Nicotiana attenuata TaxID=49451 RepID=UPI000904E176